MFTSISGVPGIIGMCQINGNGFYKPSNEMLSKYIIPGSNCIVDLENVSYPFELVLIGYQDEDEMCFKECVTAYNANQMRYLYNNISRYAASLPKSCTNKDGLNLRDDLIIPYDRRQILEEIK